MKRVMIFLIVLVAIIGFMIGGVIRKYNRLQQMTVEVKSAWAQVENVYQTRFDLVPNLVATVQGAANFEKSTLTAVTEARAKMGGTVNLSKDAINDPAAFAKLQQMQDGLGSALQRLMVVAERYPDLKANQNFMALQEQLEGIENRIRQERRTYNTAAENLNKSLIVFPNNLIAGMFNIKEAQFFKANEAAQQAPKVEFK